MGLKYLALQVGQVGQVGPPAPLAPLYRPGLKKKWGSGAGGPTSPEPPSL